MVGGTAPSDSSKGTQRVLDMRKQSYEQNVASSQKQGPAVDQLASAVVDIPLALKAKTVFELMKQNPGLDIASAIKLAKFDTSSTLMEAIARALQQHSESTTEAWLKNAGAQPGVATPSVDTHR